MCDLLKSGAKNQGRIKQWWSIIEKHIFRFYKYEFYVPQEYSSNDSFHVSTRLRCPLDW